MTSNIDRNFSNPTISQIKKELKCDICNKYLSTKLTLENHIQSIHEQKHDQLTKNCEVCKQSYKSRVALSYHMKMIHSEWIRPECEFCEKTFVTKNYLERHIKDVHESTNDKNEFKCQFCDKPPYAEKKHLEKHMDIVHEGIRYNCDFCGMKYTEKIVLKRHIKSKHSTEEEKRVQCDECYKNTQTS